MECVPAAEQLATSAEGTDGKAPREPRCESVNLIDLRKRTCYLECGEEDMTRKELVISEGTEAALIAREVFSHHFPFPTRFGHLRTL